MYTNNGHDMVCKNQLTCQVQAMQIYQHSNMQQKDMSIDSMTCNPTVCKYWMFSGGKSQSRVFRTNVDNKV